MNVSRTNTTVYVQDTIDRQRPIATHIMYACVPNSWRSSVHTTLPTSPAIIDVAM